MAGKMSTFISEKESTPRTNIRSAMTATESGRRKARRTIHIGREAFGNGARFYARKAFRSLDQDRAPFRTEQVSLRKRLRGVTLAVPKRSAPKKFPCALQPQQQYLSKTPVSHFAA